MARRLTPCYRSLNKPLTIMGVERRLLFWACMAAGLALNLVGSLVAALMVFITMLVFARWATERDPQILRLFIDSMRRRPRYDAAKF